MIGSVKRQETYEAKVQAPSNQGQCTSTKTMNNRQSNNRLKFTDLCPQHLCQARLIIMKALVLEREFCNQQRHTIRKRNLMVCVQQDKYYLDADKYSTDCTGLALIDPSNTKKDPTAKQVLRCIPTTKPVSKVSL